MVAGLLYDKIGRMYTMAIMMIAQSAMMVALLIVGVGNPIFMAFAATAVGFNYGTNLSIFPAAIKDFFGLKNFGANYGLAFTAWGVGGFFLPKIAQISMAATGTFNTTYLITAILLAISAGVAFMTNSPQRKNF
jgi:MFS family permease